MEESEWDTEEDPAFNYTWHMWFPGDGDTEADLVDAEDVCYELVDQNCPEELPLWRVMDLATKEIWTGDKFLAEFGG